MSKNSGKTSIWRGILLSLLGLILVASLTFGVLVFLEKNKSFLGNAGFQGKEAIFEARSDLENSAPSVEEVQEHQVAPDEPRYMTIERISVDQARVVGIGVSGPNNQLGDPTNIHDVGWYNASAKPGQATEKRPAGLYDGHNTGIYSRGVFYKLGDLQSGDIISVERGDGQKFSYQVREIETVPINDVDMKKMLESAEAGVEGLNLISCAGNWDAGIDTYSHRVLVRAVLIQN